MAASQAAKAQAASRRWRPARPLSAPAQPAAATPEGGSK